MCRSGHVPFRDGIWRMETLHERENRNHGLSVLLRTVGWTLSYVQV